MDTLDAIDRDRASAVARAMEVTRLSLEHVRAITDPIALDVLRRAMRLEDRDYARWVKARAIRLGIIGIEA